MRALAPTIARYPALIVFACIIGMALGAPVFLLYGFGVFIDPLTEEFSVGRGPVSLASSFGLLANILAGPAVGLLTDRFGARRTTLLSVVAVAATLGTFSFVQNVYQFQIVAVLMVLLGAGTGPVTFTRIISGWFNERRGLALGFALTGIGIGGIAAPVISQELIDEFGWRIAYQYLSLMVLVVSLPALFLLLRERPAETAETDGSSEREPGLGVAESLRQPTFWVIAIGFLLVAVGNTGGLVHLAPLLTDAGLTPERAAWYAAALSVGVIGGRALGGYLIDIFHAPYVAICCLAGPFAAYAIYITVFDPTWVIVPVILFGIGMGAEFDVIPFLVSRYFGLRNFGALYGIQISTFSIGSAIGIAGMGFGFDKYGSYDQPIIAAMVVLVIGALLISRLGAYRFK